MDVLIDEPFVSTATALAHSTSGESAAKLKGMVAEAIRLSPALAGVTREVASDTVVNGRKMARGDRVFVSLVDANYDVSHSLMSLVFRREHERPSDEVLPCLSAGGFCQSRQDDFEQTDQYVMGRWDLQVSE